MDKSLPYEHPRQRLTKKIRLQLISSCVLHPEKKEDEYLYAGDVLRRFGGIFVFWKKKKGISTRERLFGGLLK